MQARDTDSDPPPSIMTSSCGCSGPSISMNSALPGVPSKVPGVREDTSLARHSPTPSDCFLNLAAGGPS